MAIDLEEIETQILALIQDDSEDVTLEDLTQEVLSGAGVFDTLMRAMSNHLEKEHAANRITGDQYAQVYSSALTQVLQQSIAFLLGKGKFRLERGLTLLQLAKLDKEIQLLCQRLVTEKAQVMDFTVLDPTADEDTSYQDPETGDFYFNSIQQIGGVAGKKIDVTNRQIRGYDDDFKTKVARLQLDSYKILYSNLGITDDFPEELKNASIDQTIERLKLDSEIVRDGLPTGNNNSQQVGADRITYKAPANT
jgi:hypothetical protein